MVYGAEAVLPSEVRYEAPRVKAYTEAKYNVGLEDNMDLLDESRDVAAAYLLCISKAFAITIATGCATAPLSKETWCFD